jgi:GNAT superfamily N-acetyltransferase
MSFAEALTITRVTAVSDVPNTVQLAPFTESQAAEIVPVGIGDQAFEYLSRAEVQRYTAHPGQVLNEFANGSRAASWGVHADGELVGFAALRAARYTRAELFLAPEFRGHGIGELALAGVLRAGLAPRYLVGHDPTAWGGMPAHITAEIHRDNEVAKLLFNTFGFKYVCKRPATGDLLHRVSIYELPSVAAAGAVDTGKRYDAGQAVKHARARLQEDFIITAHGRSHLPKNLDYMVRPHP